MGSQVHRFMGVWVHRFMDSWVLGFMGSWVHWFKYKKALVLLRFHADGAKVSRKHWFYCVFMKTEQKYKKGSGSIYVFYTRKTWTQKVIFALVLFVF